jgi:hypothetical protein
MFEPGTFLTGGRMILSGIKWIIGFRDAPWSAVTLSADIKPHIAPWYSVRIFSHPEKTFAIDFMSVRSICPKRLLLCKADPSAPRDMLANSEATVLKELRWTIPEKGKAGLPFQRFFVVKLEGLKGEKKVDFELEAQFHDNRRTKTPVYARTNPVILNAT